jgi:hypothetical protein
MDLGIDEVLNALGVDAEAIDASTRANLEEALRERIAENNAYLADNLFTDLRAGMYDATGEDGSPPQEDLDIALEERLGMYASELWPAASEGISKVSSSEGVLLLWELDPAADHCDNCPEFADGGPYSDPDEPIEGAEELPAFPGDGTDCLTNCRCTLEFDPETWKDYVDKNALDEAA